MWADVLPLNKAQSLPIVWKSKVEYLINFRIIP